MMTCDASREAIVLAAYGELGAARLGELKSHLRTCAACAEQAREVHASRELIASAEGHALPQPWLEGVRSNSRWMRMLPRASLLAAAAILVAALAVFTTSRIGNPDISGIPSTGPLLASGSLAEEAATLAVSTGTGAVTEDAYLGDDGLGDEIESLQSELTSLESKMREF